MGCTARYSAKHSAALVEAPPPHNHWLRQGEVRAEGWPWIQVSLSHCHCVQVTPKLAGPAPCASGSTMSSDWTLSLSAWDGIRVRIISLGSGPRYMICVTLFLHVVLVRKHRHARIAHVSRARVSRAFLACQCVFWQAQHAKKCDKIWYLWPLPKGQTFCYFCAEALQLL